MLSVDTESVPQTPGQLAAGLTQRSPSSPSLQVRRTIDLSLAGGLGRRTSDD